MVRQMPKRDDWRVLEEDKVAWDEYQLQLAELKELLIEELERLVVML